MGSTSVPISEVNRVRVLPPVTRIILFLLTMVLIERSWGYTSNDDVPHMMIWDGDDDCERWVSSKRVVLSENGTRSLNIVVGRSWVEGTPALNSKVSPVDCGSSGPNDAISLPEDRLDVSHPYAFGEDRWPDDSSSYTVTSANIRIADIRDKGSGCLKIEFWATNPTGSPRVATLIVEVQDAPNQAPTDIGLSSTEIDENQSTGTSVGSFTTTDDGWSSQDFQYSKAGLDDSTYEDNWKLFTIDNATDQLKTVRAFNYETESDPIKILVKVQDPEGESFEKEFEIQVKDVNEKPTAQSQSVEVAEDASISIDLGVDDQDAGDVPVPEIVRDPTYGSLGDVESGAVRYFPRPNFVGTDTFTFRAYDGEFYSDPATVTVEVIERNRPPYFSLDPPQFDVNEGSLGAIDLSSYVTDPEGDDIDFEIAGDGGADGDLFEFSDELLTFRQPRDYEGGRSDAGTRVYEVNVVAKDIHGNTSTPETIKVEVKDLDSTGVTIEPTTVSGMDEVLYTPNNESKTSAARTVADLDVSGDDIGTLYFELIGNSDSRFEIDRSNRKLKIKEESVLNYEATDNTLTAKIRVSDTAFTANGTYPSHEHTFTIRDLNEAPYLSFAPANSNPSPVIPGGSGVGVAVGTVAVFDDDNSDDTDLQSHTLKVFPGTAESGTESAVFEMVENSLKTKMSLANETAASYQVTIVATENGDTPMSGSQTISIAVIQNSPPEFTAPTDGFDVPENQTTVGTVQAQDPDGVSTIAYSLVETDDHDLFEIGSSSGTLTFKSAPDYEALTANGGSDELTVNVRATELPSGPSADLAITVTVENVNELPLVAYTDVDESLDESDSNPVTIANIELSGDELGTDLVSIDNTTDFQLTSLGNRKYRVSTKDPFELDAETRETGPTSVTVRVTDSDLDDEEVSRQFDVNVADLDLTVSLSTDEADVPEIPAADGSTVSQPIIVATLNVSGDLAGSQYIELSSDSDPVFELVSDELRIKKDAIVNYEAATTHTAKVRGSDEPLDSDNMNVSEASFTLEVENVNEPPNSLTLDPMSVGENMPAGTVVGSFTTGDPDNTEANTVHTHEYAFSIGDPVENDLFRIDGNDLKTKGQLDAENPPSADKLTFSAKTTTITAGVDEPSFVQSFTVAIDGVNEPPTIAPIGSFIIQADTQSIQPGVVITSDPDTSRGSLSFSATSSNTSLIEVNQITVSQFVSGENQDLVVTPVRGQSGSTDVVLTVMDGEFDVSSSSFTITVNAPPSANGDSFDLVRGASNVALDVLGNDSMEPDTGETLSILSVNYSGGGSVTISENRDRLVYSPPNSSFLGTETFTYRIGDGRGGEDTATVTVEVELPPNQGPTLTSTSFRVPENSTSLMQLTATDPEARPVDFYLVNNPGDKRDFDAFRLTGNNRDQLQFRTAPDFENPTQFGPDRNRYQIKVGVRDEGDLTDERWVQVDVLDVVEPTPPTIEPLFDERFPANEIFLYHDAVRVNDLDTPLNNLVLTVFSSQPSIIPPENITVTGQGEMRDLQIIPAPNQFGPVTITFTVDDGDHDPVNASFVYTVLPKGIPPADTDEDTLPDYVENVAGNGVKTAPPDLSDWEEMDSDGDGLDDNIELANGFNPCEGDTDGDGVGDRVEFGNHDPSANLDFARFEEGDLDEKTIDVLENDTFLPDSGETLTIVPMQVSGRLGGAITVAPDNLTLRYTLPGDNITGIETYDYTITDGRGGHASSRVTITLADDDKDPVLDPIGNVKMPVNVTWSPFEFTVVDPDGPDIGDTMTFQTDNPTLFPQDSLVFNGTGPERSFSLSPAPDQYGTATITLVAFDGSQRTETHFEVTVGPHGFPPADSDEDTLPDYVENKAGNGVKTAPPDLSNWEKRDSDGDGLYDDIELVNGFDPCKRDTDGDDVTDDIEFGNNDPVAVENRYRFEEGDVDQKTLRVLENDSYLPDSDEVLTIVSVEPFVGGLGGSLTVASDTVTLLYTLPGDNIKGQETYEYTITDGRGGHARAEVIIAIADDNKDPVLSPIASVRMPVNVTWEPFEFTVTDPDGPVLPFTMSFRTTNPSLFPTGSVQFTESGGDRWFSLTPAMDQFGTAQITLEATAGNVTGEVSFNVKVGPHGFLPADTDADSAADYEEDLNGDGTLTVALMETNWVNVDADGDLLADIYEIFLGTDPQDQDTDGDGVSDYIEVLNGRDPLTVPGWSVPGGSGYSVNTVQPSHTSRLP